MSFFKKLFKNVIRDTDPKDDTVTVKGKPKPKYYGTVTPYPNFNASSDASVLQTAFESKGVDEDVVIAMLVNRSNEQRQKIKVVYEASTGKSLNKSLKAALRSHLEDVSLALFMVPPHFDAHLLRKATKRLGTDEDVLVEVLATRSNHEIQEMKKAFKEEYKTDLEDVIKAETSGDFTTALLAMLKANRAENTEVDMDLARRDAKTLFEAGENTSGVNVNTFIDILTTRSGPQLSKSECLKCVIASAHRFDSSEAETAKHPTKTHTWKNKWNQVEHTQQCRNDTEQSRTYFCVFIIRGVHGLLLLKKMKNSCTLDEVIDSFSLQTYVSSKAFQQYACVSDITLPKALDMKLKGDIEDCLSDIVKCSWNTPAFFAEKLHLAMKGHGTCEDTLTRVLVSRSEIDLKKILEQYRAMYDVNLQEDIVKDTKGHYRDILLGLCGPH